MIWPLPLSTAKPTSPLNHDLTTPEPAGVSHRGAFVSANPFAYDALPWLLTRQVLPIL